MKKILILVSVILIVIGIFLSLFALYKCDFNFSKFEKEQYTLKYKHSDKRFNVIDIRVSDFNIEITPSATDECKVYYPESEYTDFDIEFTDNKLSVTELHDAPWYVDWFNIGNNKKITVELPQREYKSISIDSTSGNILMNNEAFSESIKIKATSGNIKLNNTKSLGTANLTATSGNIFLSDFDAENINIKVTSGNIKGNLLSDKIFVTKSTSGNISVPKTEGGGTCKIITTSGNISVSISDK